jgi:hypothetical protein
VDFGVEKQGEGQGMMNLLESHARVMSPVEAEGEEHQAYCVISPEEMAERATRRRAQIESQRIEFVPQSSSLAACRINGAIQCHFPGPACP